MSRKQLNLKLKEDRYGRWTEYVEENPEYTTMTDFIRKSVEKEINGNHESPSGGSSREMAEMKDRINSLSSDVDRLTKVISALQEDIKSDPSDKHIRSELFAALPPEDSMKGPVTPEELAKDMGPIDRDVISQTLESMEEEIKTVKVTFGHEEGVMRYYKVIE